MGERPRRERPLSWAEYAQHALPRWATPFHGVEWVLSWLAWWLGRWALLDVLEHLGALSILVAVVFYFSERGDRTRQRHYQAWQVINTAQAQGGSGGRVEALQELNSDKVALTGVSAGGAFLQGIHLADAQLSRCDLHASDLRGGLLQRARLDFCNLRGANLRGGSLAGADLRDAELQDADLQSTDLTGADLTNADLSRADLRSANASDMNWKAIASLKLANIYDMRNMPKDFAAFAISHGAVSLESDEQWNVLLRKAQSPQQ